MQPLDIEILTWYIIEQYLLYITHGRTTACSEALIHKANGKWR